MGQKYAAYSNSGQITGFYDSVDSPAPAGVQAIAITDQEWQTCLSQPGWTVANGALVAPPPYVPTLAEQAAAALMAPVAVTSTSTPALSASYTITRDDQTHIQAEVQSLMLNGTFADGSSAVAWPDASGAVHTFTVAQFKAFATAVGAFVAACYKVLNGSSTTLPSAALTIA